MPAKDTRKAKPLSYRLSTNVDSDIHQAFIERATAAGVTDAKYLRRLIEADLGRASPATLKRRSEERVALDTLAHEVNQVGLQIRKAGVNINQLAKQANAGLVPITRSEAVQIMTELQVAMSLAVAVLELALE